MKYINHGPKMQQKKRSRIRPLSIIQLCLQFFRWIYHMYIYIHIYSIIFIYEEIRWGERYLDELPRKAFLRLFRDESPGVEFQGVWAKKNWLCNPKNGSPGCWNIKPSKSKSSTWRIVDFHSSLLWFLIVSIWKGYFHSKSTQNGPNIKGLPNPCI